MQQGRLREAEPLFRAIIARNPRHHASLLNLAFVLTRQSQFEEAERVLKRALNQRPNSAAAHNMLGHALLELHRPEDAAKRFRRAISIEPGLADAHAGLSSALVALGRFAQARAAIDRAVELSPDRASYQRLRANMWRFEAADPRLAALETLMLQADSMLPEERIALEYALGKAYSDLGEVDRSFQHYMQGAALKRGRVAYDEQGVMKLFGRLAQVIDAQFLAERRGFGNASPGPIFIVGMPRSGTTLVEQILGSHPAVSTGDERPEFRRLLIRACGAADLPPTFPALLAPWSASDFERLGTDYLAALGSLPPPATRMTDKMPANFWFAGLIHLALPNARIIHMRRDPVDTCLSNFSTLFTGNGHPQTYELGELGRYYRACERLMAHWQSALPRGVILDVQYEALVDDLPGQARRVVAHCGLEWDDACLAFHESERPVGTASQMQVRSPIYRTSIGRPRPSPGLLQPLLDALGAHDPGVSAALPG
jgi:tetratricopeptide (TPR) repeat protein